MLPKVEAQEEVSARHLQTLAEMFVEHNVHQKLSVHLIHGHIGLAADMMMVSTNLTDLSACWNKPIKMADVDLSNIHGNIFKLVDDDHIVAYEFKEGTVTNLSSCSSDFFAVYICYLCAEGLEDIIGLEILDGSDDDMVEFDLTNYGTVMMKERDAQHGPIFATTGWVFHCNDEIVSYKGNESHAQTTKGTHKVFTDGKISPISLDVVGLCSILKDNNIIN